jgi:hypothetical protein
MVKTESPVWRTMRREKVAGGYFENFVVFSVTVKEDETIL